MKASKATNQKVMTMLIGVLRAEQSEVESTLVEATQVMTADMQSQLDGAGDNWLAYASQCAQDEVSDMWQDLCSMFDGGALHYESLKIRDRIRSESRKSERKSSK